MKKGMLILIGLITIVSILCFMKQEKKKESKKNNPYEVFSFYKKENLDRYEKYYKLKKLSYKDTVLRVNLNLDYSYYTHTKEVTNFDILMLVNKYNYVSKDFKVPSLKEVKEYARDGMYLESECLEAFLKMAHDASIEGINLRAISTYRTYEYQENLYNDYAKKEGIKEADTYSARPGFSEHHTGLVIDMDNITSNYLNFEKTNEFAWMDDNAYKYGFILRYPKGKEDITGYIYEPWHYRYVGIKAATYIKKNNITLEEYYSEFVDK